MDKIGHFIHMTSHILTRTLKDGNINMPMPQKGNEFSDGHHCNFSEMTSHYPFYLHFPGN